MNNLLKYLTGNHCGLLPVVAGVFTLAGCTTMHPTSPYMPSQAHLDNATQALLPVAGSDVTLQQAQAIARANNPTLASVRLAITRARAIEAQAKSRRSPRLDIISSAGVYSDGQRVIPASENNQPGVFSKNILGAELVLSYPLYTGGALKAGEEAARFAGNASHLQFIRARHEIEYSVARVFAQILAQRKLIESLQFNQKSLGSHLKIINDLIAAQKAARIDRLRVEVRIADLQQSLTRAGNDMRVSMQVLANLMGLDKGEFEIAGQLTPPGKDTSPSLASVQEQAMRDRNDLAAMDERLKAQARQVDAAKAQTKPSVFIWAGYGGRWGPDPDDDPSGADNADDVGRVGLAITYPLWDGQERAATINVKQAELAQLQKQYEALKQRVALEVCTAVLNLQSASERAKATGIAVEQAYEVLRIQRETQVLGKATLTDVLDAQTALLSAQTNYYAALAEYRMAEAEHRLSIGQKDK